jgi:hypothetical protein
VCVVEVEVGSLESNPIGIIMLVVVFGRIVYACVSMCVLFAMCACATPQRPTMLLDLQQPPPMPDLLAIQVCCSLLNRARSNATSCSTISSPNDIDWLAPSLPSPPPFTPIPTFMRACFAAAASDSVIEFNYTQQQQLVPNIITVASVLSAVPLPPSSPSHPPPPLPFQCISIGPLGADDPLVADSDLFSDRLLQLLQHRHAPHKQHTPAEPVEHTLHAAKYPIFTRGTQAKKGGNSQNTQTERERI